MVDSEEHAAEYRRRATRLRAYHAGVTDRLRIERTRPRRRDRAGHAVAARGPQRVRRVDHRRPAGLFAAPGPRAARRAAGVVLAGDGPSFCAGADLAWMRAALALDREANEQDAMAMAEMFEAIDTCPAPVIARVHGEALGGGIGLCAVADLVIAEVRRAVRLHRDAARDPARGHRAVRHRPDRRDATPGRCSPAAAASMPSAPQRIGLVHEVVEGEDALDEAVDTAIGDLLAAGPTAARAAKSIIREVRGLRHGSSKWHTARVSPGSARATRLRKGCGRSSRSAGPAGAWTRNREDRR